MGAIGAVLGVVGSFLSWLTSPLGAIVKLRAHQHVVARDQFQDHCSSYKERIALREKEFEQAAEGPDKEEKRRWLSDLRQEYDQFLEAWQQLQELAELVPRGAVSVDAPKLPPDQIVRLSDLLAGSNRLPATLLTAYDYATRGNAYHEAGDYEQALEAYNRALKLMPDHADALYNRGLTLRKLGRCDDALRDYDRALELKPDRPATLCNRGVALIRTQRYDDAIKDLNRALELRPNHDVALYNRACAYSLMGRFEEALRDLEAAIKGDEGNRALAKTDEDFANLRNDPTYGPRFWEIVGREEDSEG